MLSAVACTVTVPACADRCARHHRVDDGRQLASVRVRIFCPCLYLFYPLPPRYLPTRLSAHTHKHHQSDRDAGEGADSRLSGGDGDVGWFVIVIEIVACVVLYLMFIIWPIFADARDMMYKLTGEYPIDSGASCVLRMRVCWRVCSDELYYVACMITGVLFLLVVLPLQIWLFTVVVACYRYVRDKLVAATSLPTAYTLVKNVD
ncbi:unnamed protein product [Sphagnum balticum]